MRIVIYTICYEPDNEEEWIWKLEEKFGMLDEDVLDMCLGKSKMIDTDNRNVCLQLSTEQILNAEKHLMVDIKKHHIIPLADVGNNDFICYDTQQRAYCMFNIVDEVKFNENLVIED